MCGRELHTTQRLTLSHSHCHITPAISPTKTPFPNFTNNRLSAPRIDLTLRCTFLLRGWVLNQMGAPMKPKAARIWLARLSARVNACPSGVVARFGIVLAFSLDCCAIKGERSLKGIDLRHA